MQSASKNKITIDTIVASKIMNHQAGAAYQKRAIGYFVIVGKDTSAFKCIFVELKDSGKVCIDLNIPVNKDGITYRPRMKEIKRILPVAVKPYAIVADKIFPEHLQLTTKEDLYQMGNIEADTTKNPEKILDCLTVVCLKKIVAE